MENNIVFEPVGNYADYVWLMTALAVCVILLVISYIKKYKALPMVTGLTTLILVGSTYMTWLADTKTTSIIVEKNKLTQDTRTVSFNQIKNVSIEERHKPSLNPEAKNIKQRFLIIDIFDNKPIVLPETLFPVDSMKSCIDNRYKSWKEAKEN